MDTLRQLFDRFRSDVDDRVDPFLWTDDDLEVYLNWALTRFAERALYFFDSTTWASVAVTQDSPIIEATSANKLRKIIKIYRARLTSTEEELDVKTMAQANEATIKDDYGRVRVFSPTAWETDTGVPRVVITDYYDDGSLRIGPIPNKNDTLSLWAFRRPLTYLSFEASDRIGIEEATGVHDFDHQLALIQGMKVMAYRKNDPETQDLNLAEAEETRFFAKLEEIKLERQNTLRPAGKVRYGGI